MIIDTHVHVGYEELLSQDIVCFMKSKGIWEKMHYYLSPEGVIDKFDEAGIDIGVVFPLAFTPPAGKRWQQLNEMTAEYIQKYPNRLLGYSIINPNDIQASLVELERSVNQLGLIGIKIHPSMQSFYPNNETIFPIYEYAASIDIPILFHTGSSTSSYADKYSHPLLLDEVAVRFPKLRIILAHSGRPWYSDAALILRKHSNSYCDICANVGRIGNTKLLEMMVSFIKIYSDGTKRMFFASDSPIFDSKKSLNDLMAVAKCPFGDESGSTLLTQEELSGILWKNALSFFDKKIIKLSEE